MKAIVSALALSCAVLASGCSKLPGKPPPGPEVPRPESVLSSKALYAQNCAGCHGADGLHGPATPLASPVYQAWVDDATLHRVIAQGEPGSMMPAFAKSSGGDLTDAQVDALVRGMRADWNTGNALGGETPPPYAEDGKGSAHAGEQVYASSCATCHGPAGGKIGKAGSVLNAAFPLADDAAESAHCGGRGTSRSRHAGLAHARQRQTAERRGSERCRRVLDGAAARAHGRRNETTAGSSDAGKSEAASMPARKASGRAR